MRRFLILTVSALSLLGCSRSATQTTLPLLPATEVVQSPAVPGSQATTTSTTSTTVPLEQLLAGVDVAALLRACWPGGSISGAPKIRACQRLAELEPVPRGPYCGSLFRLGADGSFDSNILIRSLMLKDGTLWAHAGCGIVADSDPQAEAEEMGWKIQPLLDALVPAP